MSFRSLSSRLIAADAVIFPGFEQDKLDPIYLLAFLSRRNLPLRVRFVLIRIHETRAPLIFSLRRKQSNEIFKRELKDAIDKVQASRRPLLEAILDRVEVTDREVEVSEPLPRSSCRSSLTDQPTRSLRPQTGLGATRTRLYLHARRLYPDVPSSTK